MVEPGRLTCTNCGSNDWQHIASSQETSIWRCGFCYHQLVLVAHPMEPDPMTEPDAQVEVVSEWQLDLFAGDKQ